MLAEPVALGVLLGLLLGKPLGVTQASWLAVRAGVADRPAGVTWRQLHGAGWLAGVGFTMSLFNAALAFGDRPELDQAKLGILCASALAGVVGWLLLRGEGGGPAGSAHRADGARPIGEEDGLHLAP